MHVLFATVCAQRAAAPNLGRPARALQRCARRVLAGAAAGAVNYQRRCGALQGGALSSSQVFTLSHSITAGA